MTLGVALLKIPVSDLATAVDFYERALGLQAKVVAEQYGWAQLDGVTVALALYIPGKGGGDRGAGGTVDFHLSSNGLDALLERVRRVSPDAALHDNADGSRSLEFRPGRQRFEDHGPRVSGSERHTIGASRHRDC